MSIEYLMMKYTFSQNNKKGTYSVFVCQEEQYKRHLYSSSSAEGIRWHAFYYLYIRLVTFPVGDLVYFQDVTVFDCRCVNLN